MSSYKNENLNNKSRTITQKVAPSKIETPFAVTFEDNRPISAAQKILQKQFAGLDSVSRLRAARTALHSPSTPPIQRLSVALQPDDEVVLAVIRYARDNLDIDEAVGNAFGNKQAVGINEDIHLYGHGGNSSIDQVEHDLFAGIDMNTLGTRIDAGVAFPEGYSGTIYLIGCHTLPLVNALRQRLNTLTGLDLDVRGTSEILHSENDNIRLRAQSPDDETTSLRAANDIKRAAHSSFIVLRNSCRIIRNAARAAAADFGVLRGVVLQGLPFFERIRDARQAWRDAQALVEHSEEPVLQGRKSGIEDVLEALNTVHGRVDEFRTVAGDVLGSRGDAGTVRGTLATLFTELAAALQETVQVSAILVNLVDEDIIRTAFTLDQMEGPLKPEATGGGCCCFLTTACVRARGLPDDCVELETMRRFRDEVLLQTVAGRALVSEYYRCSPAIVASLEQRPDRAEILEEIYRTVQATIDQLNAGRHSTALCLYAEMVRILNRDLLAATRGG